jgi:uncharacterized protein (DUF1499 family)
LNLAALVLPPFGDRIHRRLQRLKSLLIAGLLLLCQTLAAAPAQASLLHLAGPVPANLGLQQNHLAPCGSPAHCARARWPLAQEGTSIEQLVPVILGLEGVEVVDTRAGYLHATASSRLFGFIDDLEIHTLPASHELEVRSASRLGDSDLGVNARRLERLHRLLMEAHVVAATPE